MKPYTDTEVIANRLKRIEGQIRGLIRMLDEGKTCEEILIQISSAKSSLHKTGQALLESHLSYCVRNGIRKGKGEEAIKKLIPAIRQFSRLG